MRACAPTTRERSAIRAMANFRHRAEKFRNGEAPSGRPGKVGPLAIPLACRSAAPPRAGGGAGSAAVAMAPPDFAGSIGLGKRSVAKEEGANARNTDEDDEPDLLKLSPVGEVLRRASEAGSGVLSVGRCAMLTGWSLPGITRTHHGHGISTPASQCLSDKPAPARPPLASERGR